MKTISYSSSGVNYELVDPLKKFAQMEGKKTAKNLKLSKTKEVIKSRGESAYVVEFGDCYLAMVEECLGTKSLVADETRKITGKTYYDLLAQDTVAYMINDLITVGAKSVSVVAYWAIGSSDWFKDKKRMNDLVKGWVDACNMAEASWGGGETPVLSGIIHKETVDLAGACFGIVKPKERLILGDKLCSGDIIIFFESRGIQSNGVSLARKIAKRLPKSYATKLSDGKLYGEALLVPTIIYAKLIQDLLENDIDIHYMVNITGHGWRKLMRAKKPFSYDIDNVPPVPELFNFIQKHSGLSDKEMYATFNMGAGFAVFVSQKDTERVIQIAKKHKIKAWICGRVEKGAKKVAIESLNIIYTEKDLQIR